MKDKERIKTQAMLIGKRTLTKQILVVNEEVALTAGLADWLAADGYEVTAMNSVQELLGQLQSQEPDLILLDLSLSVMDGIEVLRIIRASHPRVPVITMVEAALYDLAVRSLKAGACAFLLKPFECQHVRQILRWKYEILDGERSVLKRVAAYG